MKRLASLFLLMFSIVSAAQQPANPTPRAIEGGPASAKDVDPAKVVQIRRLLELTGNRAMVNQMKTELMEQFRVSMPDLPPEMFDEMLVEMKAEDIEEAMIPIYAKHFTEADLKQLVAFYDSPFGKKLMTVMPQIIQEANKVGIDWGQSVVTRVAEKWRREGKLTQTEYERLTGKEQH